MFLFSTLEEFQRNDCAYSPIVGKCNCCYLLGAAGILLSMRCYPGFSALSAGLWAAILVGTALSLPAQTAPTVDNALFDGSFLHEISLTVAPEDWAKLKENYLLNTNYPADFRWQGNAAYSIAPQELLRVGIRSRGSGSRSPVKPSLRIDFNRYDKQQRLLGLSSIVLDNAIQDQSYLRERLSQNFFARLGVAAPRATHTKVTVNGEYLGLYILLERLDDGFLTRAFGTTQGDFYEYNRLGIYRFENLGDDPALYIPEMFENKNDNPDKAAFVRLIQVINSENDADYIGRLSEVLDFPALVRYLAIENYLSERDGLAGIVGSNNFYLYRRPEDGKFLFVPWDKDLTLTDIDHPVDFGFAGHPLLERLWQQPEFRRMYSEELKRCYVQDGGWLAKEARFVAGQLTQAIADDPYWRCSENAELACSASFAREAIEGIFVMVDNRPERALALATELENQP